MTIVLLSSSIISTHILTRRMTFLLWSHHLQYVHFNSHPHEEDDTEMCVIFSMLLYFNSHPHEEDDRPEFFELVDDLDFNSHPHEEDDGYGVMTITRQQVFQLTSSRGG